MGLRHSPANLSTILLRLQKQGTGFLYICLIYGSEYLYEEQLKIQPALSEAQQAGFLKDNNTQSNIYNKYQLKSRPEKNWDYE